MRIGFLGDLHGSLPAARFMLWSMHKKGITTVIQVGDFGIYTTNDGLKFANKVNELCMEYGITLIVVPGNHENWRVINEQTGENRTELAPYRSHIHIAPRGYRTTFDGMSFVMLGGAPSVDRKWRREYDAMRKNKEVSNLYWYAEEQITAADVEYTVAGGYADVMVGHDAPRGIQGIESKIRGNPFGFHPTDLLYAEEGRILMTEAYRGVAPRFFFHGHYHFPVNEKIIRPDHGWDDPCQVIGLDCEHNNYSMAVLDTKTRTVEQIDHKHLLFQFRRDVARPWPK